MKGIEIPSFGHVPFFKDSHILNIVFPCDIPKVKNPYRSAEPIKCGFEVSLIAVKFQSFQPLR